MRGTQMNIGTEQKIDELKQKIRGLEASGTGLTAAAVDSRTPVPVPPWMGAFLQEDGLRRGSVTQVSNCPAALVHMLAAVTAQGGCAAVVDHPNLAVAAVAAAGGDIDRLVLVPDATPHTAAVLATLVEGMDMVLYRPQLGQAQITPTFARPVDARLKKSECAFVTCGGQWPTARVHIDMHVSGIIGLGQGSGRVRSIELEGRAWGKSQPPRTFRTRLGASWDGDEWMDALDSTVRPLRKRVAQ